MGIDYRVHGADNLYREWAQRIYGSNQKSSCNLIKWGWYRSDNERQFSVSIPDLADEMSLSRILSA